MLSCIIGVIWQLPFCSFLRKKMLFWLQQTFILYSFKVWLVKYKSIFTGLLKIYSKIIYKWALSTVRLRLDMLSRSVWQDLHTSFSSKFSLFYFNLKIKGYNRKRLPYMVSIRIFFWKKLMHKRLQLWSILILYTVFPHIVSSLE